MSKLLPLQNNRRFEILIAGDSSLILAHNFRASTEDIDAYWGNQIGLEKCIKEVCNKYSIEKDWLNNDFTKSNSFSIKLVDNAEVVANYSNLVVKRVCDLDLFCMKLISWRLKDIDDLVGLLRDFNDCYTQCDIAQRLEYLYGDNWTFKLSDEAKKFVRISLSKNMEKGENY